MKERKILIENRKTTHRKIDRQKGRKNYRQIDRKIDRDREKKVGQRGREVY